MQPLTSPRNMLTRFLISVVYVAVLTCIGCAVSLCWRLCKASRVIVAGTACAPPGPHGDLPAAPNRLPSPLSVPHAPSVQMPFFGDFLALVRRVRQLQMHGRQVGRRPILPATPAPPSSLLFPLNLHLQCGAIGFTPLDFCLPMLLYNMAFKGSVGRLRRWAHTAGAYFFALVGLIAAIGAVRWIIVDSVNFSLFADL